MTTLWRARVAELFERALQVPAGAAREALLADTCGSRPDLLAEVRSLLAAHEQAGDFLEASPRTAAHALLGDRLLQSLNGRRFGVWRIERPIYAGGMGAVYLAHREGAEFEQRAALKIIRADLAHPGALERFAQERQVLARLEHPGIARLLDGGTTEDGLPWLVMEYVEGQPIDQWIEARALGLHERLVLFERVCAAVQYAHRHLVIHRDIKPGNILVTEDGAPKLLDFGIAKLLPEAGVHQEATATQYRAFTPGYASPEQFSGAGVTTASDVYSLGALLYRLLTGRVPFVLDQTLSPAEAERLVTRRPPDLPSAAVQRPHEGMTVPRVGDWRAAQLQRALRGDLDTIVMTALRKEPERRFESVGAFAEDLRRYRNGLPVQARPDTVGYRTRKFTARHWKSLAAAGFAFAALAAGLVLALWQAEEARAERDRAQRINVFLQDILVEADPYASGEEATVRDMLRKADGMLAERFAGEPQIEAALRYTIGYTQLSLLAIDDAARNLTRADQLNRELYGPDDARTLQGALQLASLAYERGDVQAAGEAYEAAIARLTPAHPADLRLTAFNDYGLVLLNSDRSVEALEYLQRARQELAGMDGPDDSLAVVHSNIGHAQHNLGELGEAERNYRRALELMRAAHPDGRHPDGAAAANNLGVLLYDLGRRDEALPLYEESLAVRRAVLGERHPRTSVGHLNLAKLMMELGRRDEARPHIETALDISRAGLGERHVNTLLARAAMARLIHLEGDPGRAARELAAVRSELQAVQAASEHLDSVDRWLDEARAAQ